MRNFIVFNESHFPNFKYTLNNFLEMLNLAKVCQNLEKALDWPKKREGPILTLSPHKQIIKILFVRDPIFYGI